MKQLKTTILLTMLMSMIGTKTFAYDAYIDGIYYNLKGTEATVTYLKQNSSSNKTAYSGNIVIPNDINYNNENYKVTSIDSYAFYECSELTSVSIGDNISSIGDYAFEHCTSLSSIIIPNSVTIIGYCAFSDTPWYDNQPNGLVYAGKVAYRYKGTMPSNTSITLKDGTLGIAFYAFANCTGLKSITIPNSVTTICNQAFFCCSNLRNISIPNSVTSIYGHPFNGTAWYDNQPNGLVYAGKVAYRYKGTMPSNTSISLVDGTKGIASFAFSGCEGLVSIVIPNSVTTICDGAFRNCANLISVSNSDNIQCIGLQTFEGCSSLCSINIPESTTFIGRYAFSGCSSLAALTIPNSITYIDEYAFQNCNSLNAIAIPNSVKTIESAAFQYCSNLSIVDVTTNLKKVGWGAFMGTAWYEAQPDGLIYIGKVAYRYKGTMPSNTTISLKEGTTSISYGAFSGCKGLSSITIPYTVKSIGSQAFYQCNLASVKMESVNPIKITYNSFYDQVHTKAILYVPYGAKSAYELADVWKDFKNIVETPSVSPNIVFSDNYVKTLCVANWDTNGDGELSKEEASAVTNIGSVFSGKDIISFNELQYFTGLTSISGFRKCYRLTSVVIPEGVTSILTEAFEFCSSLANVTIPNSVTNISKQAFKDCKALDNVTIPENVTYIGEKAFQNCSNVTNISISNSVIKIGNNAFENCSGLVSAVIPNSVTNIGDYAFHNCSNLKNISISNNITKIGNYLFNGCSNLNEIVIPNNVNSIGDGAFGRTSLSYIDIPEGVYSIGEESFARCKSLVKVKLPTTMQTIGEYAFAWSDNSLSVIVLSSVPPSLSIGSFYSTNVKSIAYVPVGSKADYEATSRWKEDFKEIVEINTELLPLLPQSLTSTVPSSKTYGNNPYQLPNTTDEGIALTWTVSDETIATISNNILTINNAGTTLLTASNEGSNEYLAFRKEFTLNIGKAPLTITANDQTKQEGEDNPTLTVTYSGFVNGEDASSLTIQPTITTTATKDSPVGTYPITVSSAASNNYTFNYVNGVLTVIAKPAILASLYVEDTSVRCGSEAVIPVLFESEAEYGGLQCELTLPAGITLSKLSKTDRLSDDFVLQKSKIGDNTWQILLYNTSRQSFSGNDGALFTMTVDVDDDMAEGDYTMTFSNIVASGVDESQDDLADYSTTIRVEKYLMGDANRDGRVNVTDIMAVANHILKQTGSNFNEKAADVNGDGRVNVTDIMGIANIILKVNTEQNAPARALTLDPQ